MIHPLASTANAWGASGLQVSHSHTLLAPAVLPCQAHMTRYKLFSPLLLDASRPEDADKLVHPMLLPMITSRWLLPSSLTTSMLHIEQHAIAGGTTSESSLRPVQCGA